MIGSKPQWQISGKASGQQLSSSSCSNPVCSSPFMIKLPLSHTIQPSRWDSLSIWQPFLVHEMYINWHQISAEKPEDREPRWNRKHYWRLISKSPTLNLGEGTDDTRLLCCGTLTHSKLKALRPHMPVRRYNWISNNSFRLQTSPIPVWRTPNTIRNSYYKQKDNTELTQNNNSSLSSYQRLVKIERMSLSFRDKQGKRYSTSSGMLDFLGGQKKLRASVSHVSHDVLKKC